MLHLQFSERDAERLIAGEQPHDRPDLVEVARFLARLRALGEVENAPPMSPQLLAELDLAEAEGQPDGNRDGDEVRRRREDARRRAHVARRWRLVGAAAMLAMLGGIVVAHQHGAFPSGAPSHTTDAPAGADPPLDDEPGPATMPVPTEPPVTAPPETEPPPTDPPADTTPSDDQVVTSGDGQNGPRDDGYDGRGLPPPFTDQYEQYQEWMDACGGDWVCLMDQWNQTYGPGGPASQGP